MCLLALFMVLVDVSIVNVALPSIHRSLDASASALQWLVAGYALASGLVLIPAGRLGDARERRTVFAAGLTVFTVASALAGAAANPTWLVLARVAQGVGAGIVAPQVVGFIQHMFPAGGRGKAFGLLGSTVGVATATGPVLGGVLVLAGGAENGWRWVFYVNLPLGALALALVPRLLPGRVRSDRPERQDPVGVALLAVFLLLIMWPLVTGGAAALGARPWWLLALAAPALAAFVGWERWHGARGGAPVVDLALFADHSYALGAALAAAYFAGFTSLFMVLMLYLQNGLNFSPLQAGLIGAPFAVGSALGAPLGGRMVGRYGRRVVVVGALIVALALGAVDMIVSLLDHRLAWALPLPLLLAGLGNGLVITPNQNLTLARASTRGGGSAGGMLQTAQRLGSALGIAVVTAVFFSHLAATGDYAASLGHGLRVTVAFVALGFLIGLVDLLADRRQARAVG